LLKARELLVDDNYRGRRRRALTQLNCYPC
jgi:hypothetical protein